MQEHTKIYLKYAKTQHGLEPWEITCEITGAPGTDVCHIQARGMGGNPSKDLNKIENLMCLTRYLHHETEGVLKEELIEMHESWMRTGQPLIVVDPDWLFSSALKPILEKLKIYRPTL